MHPPKTIPVLPRKALSSQKSYRLTCDSGDTLQTKTLAMVVLVTLNTVAVRAGLHFLSGLGPIMHFVLAIVLTVNAVTALNVPPKEFEEFNKFMENVVENSVVMQNDTDPETRKLEFARLLDVNGWGFGNCINPPSVCPNDNVTFWLYTREQRVIPQQLDPYNLSSIEFAKFSEGAPLKVLIHGYTGNKDFSPNAEIRKAYLDYGEYNVLSIDYAPLAQSPCYVQAAYNVPLVGNCTAKILDLIVKYNKVPFENIHVVGFSLGAQVAGNIANYIKAGKLKRITGLDPALPLFTTFSTEPRLDPTDAEFVDVIHTNAGWKGKLAPSGHLDFFLNSIISQPGCSWDSSCNHARAPEYFAESIGSPRGFWGFSCSSVISFFSGVCAPEDAAELVLMGEHCNTSARGIYFAYTNPTYPFAKGNDLAEVIHAVSNSTNEAMNNVKPSVSPGFSPSGLLSKLASVFRFER